MDVLGPYGHILRGYMSAERIAQLEREAVAEAERAAERVAAGPWYLRSPLEWKWEGSGCVEGLRDYYAARCERVWRLRAEGLTLAQVGVRLGLSRERVRQLQVYYARCEGKRGTAPTQE